MRFLPRCAVEQVISGETSATCEQCLAAGLPGCSVIAAGTSDRLNDIVDRREYQPGEVLLAEGDTATFIGLISSGTAAVSKHTEDGRRQIVGFLDRSDLFGITSSAKYYASVEALTRVVCCFFPRDTFNEIIEGQQELSRSMLLRASHELEEAATHQLILGRLTARERVAAFLGSLAAKRELNNEFLNVLDLPMSRTDIADYLGLSMEHVSRAFGQLSKDKLIDLTSPRRIKVIDRAGLIRAGNL